SGTDFMSQLLSAGAPGVCVHELLVQLAPSLIPRATAWYEGRCAADAVTDLFGRYQDASATIDANWKLTWVLPLLVARFPQARIVHLVRDPRPNVRSCVELDYYGHLVEDPRFPMSDELRLWLTSMPRVTRPDWDELEMLDRVCAFWD